MAVVSSASAQTDVDWYLSAFEREAHWAVDLATRWDLIDEHEQEDLAAEWPLTIDYLLRSLSYLDKGLMSSEQCQRLDAIRAFLHEHEPVLAKVLGAGNLMLDPPREWYASLPV